MPISALWASPCASPAGEMRAACGWLEGVGLVGMAGRCWATHIYLVVTLRVWVSALSVLLSSSTALACRRRGQ